MSALAILIAGLLTAISGLHAYWAFGGLWPAETEKELIRMVVGEPWRSRMPGRGLTLLVAAALLSTAAVALLARWPGDLPSSPVALAGAALAVVFLGRGVAAHVPAWRRSHPAEPFARLDRRLYSPLCLLLGAGFLALAFGRWSAP